MINRSILSDLTNKQKSKKKPTRTGLKVSEEQSMSKEKHLKELLCKATLKRLQENSGFSEEKDKEMIGGSILLHSAVCTQRDGYYYQINIATKVLNNEAKVVTSNLYEPKALSSH